MGPSALTKKTENGWILCAGQNVLAIRSTRSLKKAKKASRRVLWSGVLSIAASKLIRTRLHDLLELQRRMEEALAKWYGMPNVVPDRERVHADGID